MKAIEVYLGLSEGALGRDGEAAAWHPHAGLEAGLDALFRQAAEAPRGRWRRTVPVRLWLSGALARPFVCGPVDGLKRWHEAEAFARACAPDATGIGADCSVSLEAWPHPLPSLAVATGEATLAAILAAATTHRVALRSIRPWWAAAANHARVGDPEAALVAATDGDALTLVGWRDGAVQSANAYLPAPSPEQADKLLARLALTAGVAAGAVKRMGLSRDGAVVSADLPFGVSA